MERKICVEVKDDGGKDGIIRKVRDMTKFTRVKRKYRYLETRSGERGKDTSGKEKVHT